MASAVLGHCEGNCHSSGFRDTCWGCALQELSVTELIQPAIPSAVLGHRSVNVSTRTTTLSVDDTAASAPVDT